MEIVSLFMTDEVYDMLVTQTNIYADQYFQKIGVLQEHSRARSWRPVTVDEMQTWISLTLLTGLIDKRGRLDTYWSRDKTLATPIFNEKMPRNRFQLIGRFLHCVDNTAKPQDCTVSFIKFDPCMIY
jgi:hypothetical protein